MSVNAAAIEAFIAKGLSAQDILEIAWALEGGKPKPKIPATVANDRPRRFSSYDRRKAYDMLAERDEESCAHCGRGPTTIWRRNGLTDGDDGKYTIVYPTSNLEVDHRTPIWAGGGNELDNLWLLCIDCHKAKTATEASQRRRA